MRRFLQTALAALVVVGTLVVGVNPAQAQQQIEILQVQSWEERDELDAFCSVHYRVELQGDYGQRAKDATKDTTTQVVATNDDAPTPAEQSVIDALMADYTSLFEGFQIILGAEGSAVPTAMQSKMVNHLNANNCKPDGKEGVLRKWTPGCEPLAARLNEVFNQQQAHATGALAENAKTLVTTANQYDGGDKVILIYWALARQVSAVPEDKRFWSFLKGSEGRGGDGENGPAGLDLGVNLGWFHMSADGLNASPDLANFVVMGRYHFGGGLGLRLGAGFGVIAEGGTAAHYTELSGDTTYPILLGGVFYTLPEFTNWIALEVGVDAVSTLSDGMGILGHVGPQFRLGDHLLLNLDFSAGFLHTGKVLGDNPTSPLPNPAANGGGFGVNFGAAYNF